MLRIQQTPKMSIQHERKSLTKFDERKWTYRARHGDNSHRRHLFSESNTNTTWTGRYACKALITATAQKWGNTPLTMPNTMNTTNTGNCHRYLEGDITTAVSRLQSGYVGIRDFWVQSLLYPCITPLTAYPAYGTSLFRCQNLSTPLSTLLFHKNIKQSLISSAFHLPRQLS
jgi:hypothetical protein